MKKVLAGLAVVAFVLAFQPAEPVYAAALSLGCPSGSGATWIGPVSSFFVIPEIDRGDFTDHNGDGMLCFRVPEGFCGNRGLGADAPVCGAWVWKDNVN